MTRGTSFTRAYMQAHRAAYKVDEQHRDALLGSIKWAPRFDYPRGAFGQAALGQGHSLNVRRARSGKGHQITRTLPKGSQNAALQGSSRDARRVPTAIRRVTKIDAIRVQTWCVDGRVGLFCTPRPDANPRRPILGRPEKHIPRARGAT